MTAAVPQLARLPVHSMPESCLGQQVQYGAAGPCSYHCHRQVVPAAAGGAGGYPPGHLAGAAHSPGAGAGSCCPQPGCEGGSSGGCPPAGAVRPEGAGQAAAAGVRPAAWHMLQGSACSWSTNCCVPNALCCLQKASADWLLQLVNLGALCPVLAVGWQCLALCLQARRRSAARSKAAQEQAEWQHALQQSTWAKYDMIKVVLTEAASATKVSV